MIVLLLTLFLFGCPSPKPMAEPVSEPEDISRKVEDALKNVPTDGFPFNPEGTGDEEWGQ